VLAEVRTISGLLEAVAAELGCPAASLSLVRACGSVVDRTTRLARGQSAAEALAAAAAIPGSRLLLRPDADTSLQVAIALC